MIFGAILLSVVVLLLEPNPLDLVQDSCLAVFAADFVLRLAVVPSPRKTLFSFTGLICLSAVLFFFVLQTALGRLLASVVMILGFGIIAIPTGITPSQGCSTASPRNSNRSKLLWCVLRGYVREGLIHLDHGSEFGDSGLVHRGGIWQGVPSSAGKPLHANRFHGRAQLLIAMPPPNCRASMRTPTMTFKDLVSSISTDNDIPAGTVRKVVKAVVESIKDAVESGEDLKLPGLKIKTEVTPAREATEKRKARPELKRAVVKLRQSNKSDAD